MTRPGDRGKKKMRERRPKIDGNPYRDLFTSLLCKTLTIVTVKLSKLIFFTFSYLKLSHI